MDITTMACMPVRMMTFTNRNGTVGFQIRVLDIAVCAGRNFETEDDAIACMEARLAEIKDLDIHTGCNFADKMVATALTETKISKNSTTE